MISQTILKRRFRIYLRYIPYILGILLICIPYIVLPKRDNIAYLEYSVLQRDIDESRGVYSSTYIQDIRGTKLSASLTKKNDKWWTYPTDIKSVTRSGDDLLVLVNKEYKLSSSYVPNGLVNANNSGMALASSGILVRDIIVSDLKELNSAAKSSGLSLILNSGYRSYSQQVSTYNMWLSYNGGNVDVTDTISARPGHSQHQLGTTVDISSTEVQGRIGEQYANSKTAKWLRDNGYKYGFVVSYPKGYESVTGYGYEWWHLRYIGKENARDMVYSGKILEVWLRERN